MQAVYTVWESHSQWSLPLSVCVFVCLKAHSMCAVWLYQIKLFNFINDYYYFCGIQTSTGVNDEMVVCSAHSVLDETALSSVLLLFSIALFYCNKIWLNLLPNTLNLRRMSECDNYSINRHIVNSNTFLWILQSSVRRISISNDPLELKTSKFKW